MIADFRWPHSLQVYCPRLLSVDEKELGHPVFSQYRKNIGSGFRESSTSARIVRPAGVDKSIQRQQHLVTLQIVLISVSLLLIVSGIISEHLSATGVRLSSSLSPVLRLFIPYERPSIAHDARVNTFPVHPYLALDARNANAMLYHTINTRLPRFGVRICHAMFEFARPTPVSFQLRDHLT